MRGQLSNNVYRQSNMHPRLPGFQLFFCHVCDKHTDRSAGGEQLRNAFPEIPREIPTGGLAYRHQGAPGTLFFRRRNSSSFFCVPSSVFYLILYHNKCTVHRRCDLAFIPYVMVYDHLLSLTEFVLEVSTSDTGCQRRTI